MTAAVVGDLHANNKPRDQYRLDWMRRFIKWQEAWMPKQVILVGDLTDEKDRHSARLVNDVVDFVADLALRSDVFIVAGNHDYEDAPIPYFSFLSRLNGVRFITKPMVKVLGGVGQVLFLPHTRDYKRDWKDVNFDVDYHWIVAHNTFAGATLDNGHKISGGIPTSIFKRNKNIIAGDVHTPQQSGPVTYIGAPYTIDFGDDYEPRLFLIDDTRRVRELPSKGPQKRLIEIASPRQLSKVKVNRGDIVKVRLSVEMSHRDEWTADLDAVRAWCKEEGVVLHALQPVVVREASAKGEKRRPQKEKTDASVLRDFAHDRDVDDQTYKTGVRLMEKRK
jgi:predicted phosphodiesterase